MKIYKLSKVIKLKEITMRKEIEINGCIEIPPELSFDDFYDKFIAFIESNNWYYGGGMNEIVDGYYINPDGTKGKHVLDVDE